MLKKFAQPLLSRLAFAVALGPLSTALAVPSTALGQVKAAPATLANQISTEADRKAVSITVYKSELRSGSRGARARLGCR